MANIVTMTNDNARLWENAENLHRAELTKLERDENIAEWIRITERQQLVSGKLTETREGRPGIPKSVKDELGVEETDAKRSKRVDSLSDEAKETARETGLDNNRTAMLAAARETTPAAQVAKLSDYKASRIDSDVKSRAAREVAEMLSSRSPSMYHPPTKTPRAFEADYPSGGSFNAAGKLENDIDGSPLRARFIAGRSGGHSELEQAITPAQYDSIAEEIAGARPTAVTSREIRGDAG
jgi:hypothetical protein